jgi:hypothetical protein
VALPEKLVDAVAELARTVRLDEAEAVLVEWWASADRSEVIACEPEVRALVQRHFLPKRRRRIFEMLSAQLTRPPVSQTASASAKPETPVPAALPQVGEVAEPMADAEDPSNLADGSSHELLAKVGELNRTANPRGAEELFRKWFGLRDVPMHARPMSEHPLSMREAAHPGDVEPSTGALKELLELSSGCRRWRAGPRGPGTDPSDGIEDDVFQLSQSLDLEASLREVL